MTARQTFCRRTLLTGAGLLVVVAVAVAAVVIPEVRNEASRGGTPESAVIAFWINVGFTLASALTLFAIGIRSKAAHWVSIPVLVIVGFVILLLGIACLDAAFAYISHDAAMRSASILLFICGPVDLLIGISAFAVAFLLLKKA